ncbi:hypothetical protein CQW23_24136 [Capsicum baccatum]|uniref:NAC domain-containing protein n=1 Tax=Capsicum baccatum TaxID=33114 RepID=A0A2G2VTZ0_CAPBA|nr:hypothetical protein CQW23_24136 [Capsicum baccatum]
MGLLSIRFHPTDEKLIRYLLKFVCCKNYSCDNIQLEDLYGNKKPREIFESNSLGDEDTKKVRYFFTQLKNKKLDGTRFIRTVIGGGLWKELDGEKSVYDGPKKTLSCAALSVRLMYMLVIIRNYVIICLWKDVAAMDAILPTTQQHGSCLLNQFTSSEHNNAFHELQQDQNSEQLIKQVQTIDEIVPSAFHNSCLVYPFTVSDHSAFQLKQDQNIKQVNVVQENNIEETVPFAHYHDDNITSYPEEGTTNIQTIMLIVIQH